MIKAIKMCASAQIRKEFGKYVCKFWNLCDFRPKMNFTAHDLGGVLFDFNTLKIWGVLEIRKSFQCRLRRPLAALHARPAANAAGFAGIIIYFEARAKILLHGSASLHVS